MQRKYIEYRLCSTKLKHLFTEMCDFTCHTSVCRMVGCTPFLVVSYFYLWFVPPFITGRFIWYLGFYCLYQTLITVSIQALSGTYELVE